jgi:hypothetical protein
MTSKRKLNLNLNEIDTILNAIYKNKISPTQISKNMKISPSKVKSVIKDYSEVFLNKFPQYKPIDEISADMYELHISNNDYNPSKLDKNISLLME